MSDIVKAAVRALNEKLGNDGIEGSAKFVITGEGSVRIDAAGASPDDGDADVTLTADADTFQDILSGALNPTAAFMQGRLGVEGDMSMAMKLGAALA